MTREEAIAVLEAIRQFTMAHYPWSKEDNEAIDMAIEALSPRRREDATKEDYAYCDDCEAVEMCMWYPYDGCIFKIQSRPKGEWHKTENEEMEITGYYCSVCDMPTDEPTNYCGNCGADMRSEKEYLDKTFPEHEGKGTWYDITDMLTK